MEDNHAVLKELSNSELISFYSTLLDVFKEKKIIRTNNLVGDIGEITAIEHYNLNKSLKLKQAEPNTKAYDAFIERKKRKTKYAIKSTSTNMTGIFWGLSPKAVLRKTKRNLILQLSYYSIEIIV